ncbi:MAG: hypothetical protein MJZ63_02370 [Muribaculaceae bacterium]|nr:hypothetical protein [Muribaculaceae bacterium]
MNRVFVLSLVVLVSAMTLACKSTKSDSENSASEQQVAVNLSEVPFLKAIGLDVSKVAIEKDFSTAGVFETEGADPKGVMLNEKQREALLDDVPMVDFDEGGGPFIVGAKAFADNVLLVYWHEMGDGHEIILVSYNKDGKLKDVVTTPSWEYTMPWDGEEAVQTVCYDSCHATFSADSFVLHRTVGRDAGKNPVWSQKRDYTYTVNADGTMRLAKVDAQPLKGTQSEKFGDHTPEAHTIYDVDYYPYSDQGLFENFDKLAGKYFKNNKLKEDLMSMVVRMMYSREELLLQYLGTHRQSAITEVLHQCIREEWWQKSELYEDIQEMPEGDSKKYLNELTAQWGPDGAVG